MTKPTLAAINTARTLLPTQPGQSRYGALASALRARILGGEWPPGTALPSEASLSAEHGVALGTLRQALDLLDSQGLVERHHGRGTFVRSSLSGAHMFRFFRFGEGAGEVPVSSIQSRKSLVAPADVARKLSLGRGERVLKLQRLRSLGGAPCLLEEIWFPLPLFELLEADAMDDWGDLLYPMLARDCGVTVTRVVDEISFGTLSSADARLLRLPAAHPCVVVHRLAYDLAGRCVEARTTRGDAHAFNYSVTIT